MWQSFWLPPIMNSGRASRPWDTGSDRPSAVMSTAEAVSVYYQTMMTAYYYGDSHMDLGCLVQNLVGAVQKENQEDMEKLRSYFQTVVRDKGGKEGQLWNEYYEARKYLK